MIPIYIGIAHKFDIIKGMTERSIRAHTQAEVEIIHLYPDVEAGCTGFSNVRYQIKHGIYLDCDMVVLGDIAELWAYRESGKFVCMYDGSTEVAVIDCDHLCRNKHEEHLLPKSSTIPPEWNVEDYNYPPQIPLPQDVKLFHWTSLPHQPWFYAHPHPEARELYKKWAT